MRYTSFVTSAARTQDMSIMKKLLSAVLPISLIPIQLIAASEAFAIGENWEETLQDEGIQIYKRTVPGSKFHEVKGETIFNVPAQQFIGTFINAVNYKNWVYGTKESYFLNTDSKSKFNYYIRLAIPWPFEDRDTTSTLELLRLPNNEGYVAKINEIDHFLPHQNGAVRLIKFKSLWFLRNANDGKSIKLTIQMHLDPGGNLTPFFVNTTISYIQMWSMKNLHKMAQSNNLEGHNVNILDLPIYNPITTK